MALMVHDAVSSIENVIRLRGLYLERERRSTKLVGAFSNGTCANTRHADVNKTAARTAARTAAADGGLGGSVPVGTQRSAVNQKCTLTNRPIELT